MGAKQAGPDSEERKKEKAARLGLAERKGES
jgi:hypothetical protein